MENKWGIGGFALGDYGCFRHAEERSEAEGDEASPRVNRSRWLLRYLSA